MLKYTVSFDTSVALKYIYQIINIYIKHNGANATDISSIWHIMYITYLSINIVPIVSEF